MTLKIGEYIFDILLFFCSAARKQRVDVTSQFSVNACFVGSVRSAAFVSLLSRAQKILCKIKMEDLMDPCSGCKGKRKGRKAYSPQKRNQLLKKRSEKWNQSRIYLGRAKERWNKLKKKYKFQTDYELAEFLMER